MKYGKYEKRPLTEDEFNELEKSRYFLSKVKDPFLKFTHNTYNYIKFEEDEQDYEGGIRCNCGNDQLKYLFKFYNTKTKKHFILGSHCVTNLKLWFEYKNLYHRQRKIINTVYKLIVDKKNEKMTCECGSKFIRRYIKKHHTTKKHINYIKSLN
jgi:hypothetical protein